MSDQPMVKDVQDWDLSSYPEKDPRNSKPGSVWFRMAYLTKDGLVDYKKVPSTVRDASGKNVTMEANAGPRRWDITGGIGKSGESDGYQGQPSAEIEGPDLIRAEQQIGGKPSIVLMGLTYEPEFNEDGEILGWKQQDLKKSRQPKFWRDVTDLYYQHWRPKAYLKSVDPFKNQKRPFTKIQELREENAVITASLQKENEELKAQLAAKANRT